MNHASFFANILSRFFIRYIRQPVVSGYHRFSTFLLSFDNVYSLFVIRYILISTIVPCPPLFFSRFSFLFFFPPSFSNVFDPSNRRNIGWKNRIGSKSFSILRNYNRVVKSCDRGRKGFTIISPTVALFISSYFPLILKIPVWNSFKSFCYFEKLVIEIEGEIMNFSGIELLESR